MGTKKKLSLGILLLFFILGVNSVRGGVGIYYDQQYGYADEGGSGCNEYSVYNPFDRESTVELGVSKELEGVVTSVTPEKITIPSNTGVENAIPIEFCFEVPNKVYREDKECTGTRVDYKGSVIVREVSQKEGGGSAASIGVSAPFTVSVNCVPREKPNINLPFPLIAVILIVLIIALLFLKAKEERQEKVVRKRKPKNK